MNSEEIAKTIRNNFPTEQQEEIANQVNQIASDAVSDFLQGKITEARQSNPALEAEYQSRLKEIPQGDIRAISKLKAGMRRRGLEVW